MQRSLHVFDTIHYDLWGHRLFIDSFRYYVIFVDNYSRFTSFYPLKAKFDFYGALESFVAVVQTQFSCKIKVFQSDGGTEFTNTRVRSLFTKNQNHHRMSCLDTPH